MADGNLYKKLPQSLEKEVFESIIKKGDFVIERIISKGHTAPEKGWFEQACDEWVVVLKGDARLQLFSGEIIRLSVGDYYHIPARVKHKVVYTSAIEPTIWLAVHY